MTKAQEIKKWSNPTTVFKLAKKYMGKTAKIQLSTKKEKKIHDNYTGWSSCSFWTNRV